MEVKESLNFPLIAPEIMPNHTPSSSVVSGVVGCLPLAPAIDCQRKSTCDLITNNILQSRTSDAANNFVIEVYNLDKVKSRPRDRGTSVKMDTFICGLCNKVYHRLLDILEHKLQHVSPTSKVGCGVCGAFFSRQVSLKEHYRRQHKIFLGKSKPCISPRLNLTNARKVSLLTRDFEPFTDSLVKEELPEMTSEVTALNDESDDLLETAAQSMLMVQGQQKTQPLCVDVLNGNRLSHELPLPSEESSEDNDLLISGTQLDLSDSGVVNQTVRDLQMVGVMMENGCPNSEDVSAMLSTGVGHANDVGESNGHTGRHLDVDETVITGGNALNDDDDDDDNNLGDVGGEEEVINMSKDIINLSEHFENPGSMSLDDMSNHVIVEPEENKRELEKDIHSLSEAIQTEQSHQMTSRNDDFSFILVTNVVRGSSFTYGKQSFKCLHCMYKTHWKNSMTKHMRDRHLDILNEPDLNNMQLNSTNMQLGDNQRLMKMSEYNKSVFSRFKNRSNSSKRVRGVEKQDLLGSYPCSKCTKVFSKLRYLRKHMQIHRTDAMFFCEVCSKSFKTRTYLAAHQRTHKKEAYKCSQCEFTSTINAAIHAHRQLHNEGSVICDICGFAYTDKSTLNKHKRVHDPSRPFACTFPGCTWRFKTDVMCQAHFRAHTTEGKFKCSLCGYIFRHKHHLQRHELKMHGIQQTKSRIPKPAATTITTTPTTTTTAPVSLTSAANEETDTLASPMEMSATDTDITNTVNLIVNSGANCSQLQLQAALQNSHLVIATDCQGETINYNVSDVAMMNMAYQTLLQEQGSNLNGDTRTILIPQTHCGQVIFQQEAESV